MTTKHPEVIVYALRLDRGLSPADVLQTPGERWTEERGLTDKHYIVPGGGGLRRSHEQQRRVRARDMVKRIQVQVLAL